MDEIKKGAETVAPPATEEKVHEEVPLQDPVKKELEKVTGAKLNKLTPAERLIFEKKKIDDQLRALGHVETDSPNDEDDDKPITRGELKEIERNRSVDTALEMAEEIENEDERSLTKLYIETKIKPSGNPTEDYRIARALVNSVKNSQIATEIARKTSPQRHVSGAGSPARTEEVFEPTSEELTFMRPPYNLTKEEIISKRPKQ